MLLSRRRSTAAVLVFVLAVALAAPPAAAAPMVPAADSWWSALAAGFDGLLGLFGLGGDDSITAASETEPIPPGTTEEGPNLDPDGEKFTTTTSVDDDDAGPGGDAAGIGIDPNG